MPPFSAKFREGDPPAERTGSGEVQKALDALEDHATTPQQHAAIKSLRNSFDVGPSRNKKTPPMSPGRAAADKFPPRQGSGTAR